MIRKKQKELKEQLKWDKFNKLCQKMYDDGYKEKVITISALKANVMALLVTIPIVIICIIPYILIHKEIQVTGITSIVLLYIAGILGIIVHELIHGITWALYCKNKWKAISFGIIWKYLTPYCTCNECLSFKSYLLGGLMPTIVLGVIPYIGSLIFQGDMMLIFSMFFIIAGGGDLYIAWLIRKQKDSVLIDHPYMVGCVVFKK